MLKKITLLVLSILTLSFASAQTKHSVRTGFGVKIINGSVTDGYSFRVGHSIMSEYQYDFNSTLGVNGHAFCSMNSYDDYGREHGYGFAIRGIYTPFPKSFRFIKIGLGFIGAHNQYFNQVSGNNPQGGLNSSERITFDFTRELVFGLSSTVRGYIVDNGKFEVILAFDPMWTTRRYERGISYQCSLLTAYFGMRF